MKGDIVAFTPPTPSAMKTMDTANPGTPAPLSKAMGNEVANIIQDPHIRRLLWMLISEEVGHKLAETYQKPSSRVLYLPSQTSEMTPKHMGVKNMKTKKPLEIEVAADWPRPSAPGTAPKPLSCCM